MSRGTLAPKQTMEGVYLGRSIPVNKKLSEIFIQLHISEKSGRGVPKIVEIYGLEVFKFEENWEDLEKKGVIRVNGDKNDPTRIYELY